MSVITDINPKFIHHYSEFSIQNSLATAFCSDTTRIYFIFFTAAQAFTTYNSEKNKMSPDPIRYISLIYNEPIQYSDLERFFKVIEDSRAFFTWIISLFQRGINTDDLLIDEMRKREDMGEIFIRILYFFIFSNSITFDYINDPELTVDGLLFKVSNTYEKESEFFDIPGEQRTLFHGTSINNMYSIMRNGLKSMSGTKFEENGKAHGSGIYLTRHLYWAHNYGNKEPYNSNPKQNDKNRCILVFEVKNVNEKGLNNFCTVNQENEIILRCIYWMGIPLINDDKIIRSLTRFSKSIVFTRDETYDYSKDLAKLSIDNQLTIKNVSSEPRGNEILLENKRFMKEVDKILDKSNWTDGIIKINFLIPEDRLSTLLVLIDPPADSNLKKDCVEMGVDGILFGVYFPSKYPLIAPSIRVISPIFEPGTGRVGFGGSICAEILFNTSQGWSPSSTILSTFISLIPEITYSGRIGEGRLDKNKSKDDEYTYTEYLRSKDFQATSHNWRLV